MDYYKPEAAHPLKAKRELVSRPSSGARESGWSQYVVGAGVLAAITLLAFFYGSKIGGPYSVALIYLLVVVVLGSFGRRGPTLMTATLSALLWNYFILPPIFKFQIEKAQDALLVGTYFIVALMLGHLTTRIRAQQQNERLREERATALYLLAHELHDSESVEQIARTAIKQLEHALKAQITVFQVEASDQLEQLSLFNGTELSLPDKEAIAWVLKHGDCAGKFTPNMPLAEALYSPLKTTGAATGVIGLRFAQSFPPTVHQRQLLDSFSQQIAFALDRQSLRQVSEHARLLAESERLSKTLLNSVSHEMRTPIAVIKSAVNNLVSLKNSDEPKTREDIIAAIQDASERLNRLVGNLLNITRLESGHVKPRFTGCDVAELIDVALKTTETALARHRVSINISPELSIVPMDFQLTEQALANLLSNAALHTPAGTSVEISARVERDFLVMQVADSGPGIRPDSMGRLFDKFYRGPSAPTGGTGLGLSLVKGFIEAQAGTVHAGNRPDGGAVFTIRMPLGNLPVPTVQTTL